MSVFFVFSKFHVFTLFLLWIGMVFIFCCLYLALNAGSQAPRYREVYHDTLLQQMGMTQPDFGSLSPQAAWALKRAAMCQPNPFYPRSPTPQTKVDSGKSTPTFGLLREEEEEEERRSPQFLRYESSWRNEDSTGRWRRAQDQDLCCKDEFLNWIRINSEYLHRR